MEHRIPEGRFTARPYVVGTFGTALDSSWKNRDNRIFTAEAFARVESWAFRNSADYLRHLDAGYCSALHNTDVVVAQGLRFYCEDEGLEDAMLSVEGLAAWCVRRVLTYPASNGMGTLVSGLEYTWEVWQIAVGEVRGVVGFAAPRIVCGAASISEMRQYVGMWSRATFGPAFLPNDLTGWHKVVSGRADRHGYSLWGETSREAVWSILPRLWSAWA